MFIKTKIYEDFYVCYLTLKNTCMAIILILKARK